MIAAVNSMRVLLDIVNQKVLEIQIDNHKNMILPISSPCYNKKTKIFPRVIIGICNKINKQFWKEMTVYQMILLLKIIKTNLVIFKIVLREMIV